MAAAATGPSAGSLALRFYMCREGTTSQNNSLTLITPRSYLALLASCTNGPAKVPPRGFLALLDTCQHSGHGLAKHKARLPDEAPWSASAFTPYES